MPHELTCTAALATLSSRRLNSSTFLFRYRHGQKHTPPESMHKNIAQAPMPALATGGSLNSRFKRSIKLSY